MIEEISTLSFKETVSLKASLLSLSDPKFQCDSCLSQYQGRADSETMTLKARELKGCLTPVNHTVKKSDSILFKKCPGNFVNSSAIGWFGVQVSLSEGGLKPFDEPYLKWPAKAIEILNIISAHRAEETRKHRAEIEARNRAQLAKGGK